MLQIQNISGALEESLFSRILAKIPSFWGRSRLLDKLAYNKHDRMARYDQKKDGSCTVFASCGAMCNNTGKNLTNEEMRAIAAEFNALDGAVTGSIARKVAKKFNCEFEVFSDVLGEIPQKILAKGYELVISVRSRPEMFHDGMVDGKIDKEYGQGTMGHAMRLKMIGGKICVVNSWGKMVEQGYKNEYEIDLKKAVETKTMRRICWFIG